MRIHWIVINPMDSAIQLFSNWGLDYIFIKIFHFRRLGMAHGRQKRTERRMKSTKYATEHGSTFGMSHWGNRTIILENLTFVP